MKDARLSPVQTRRLLLDFSKLDLGAQSSFISELNRYILLSESQRRKLQNEWKRTVSDALG